MSLTYTAPGYLAPFTGGVGYEQIQVISEPVRLTPPAGARGAFIVARGATVLWRDDGVDPAGTFGFQVLVGVPFTYVGKLSAIRFLDLTNTAYIDVVYFQ